MSNQETSPSLLSKFAHRILNPPKLPPPPAYRNLNKLAKDVCVSCKVKHEGLVANIVRPMTTPGLRRDAPTILMLHSFTLGSKAVVPQLPNNDGYQMQCHYISPQGRLTSILSQKQLVARIVKTIPFPGKHRSITTELLYDRSLNPLNKQHHHTFVGVANYKDTGYCIEGKYRGDVKMAELSFTQAVLPGLAVGTRVQNIGGTKTHWSIAMRFCQYRKDQMGLERKRKPVAELFTEMMFKDQEKSRDKILKTSYYRQIEHNTSMSTTMEWNLSRRRAALKYGFEQRFLAGSKVKVDMTDKMHLTSQLEFPITAKVLASIIAQAKILQDEYKFGITLQIQ